MSLKAPFAAKLLHHIPAGLIADHTVLQQAGLLRLCADYGPDKTVHGIGECVRHSAPTLAYLEAVLKGTGKKKLPSTDSKTYQQRDYTSEQDAAMERMMTMEW